MVNENLLSEIRKLAEEVATREGVSLYDVEFTGHGGGRILRIYIDKPGLENVSIEDCSNVSKAINLRLDVEDLIPGGAYNLEVSSPGIERVLKQPWHYEHAVGEMINVKSFAPLVNFNEHAAELGKAKTVTGELLALKDKGIAVKVGDKEIYIPFESITKAHVVFEFGSASGEDGKGKFKKKKR